MKYVPLTGLFIVLACCVLWAVLELLGLQSLAGNALTIFSAFLFFLFGSMDGREGPGIPVATEEGKAISSRLLSPNLALIMLVTFHLVNWTVLILLFVSQRSAIDQIAARGELSISSSGYQQYQLFLAGFLFFLWSLPATILFASWFGRRVPEFSFVYCIHAGVIAFAISTLMRLLIDPGLLMQTTNVLELALGVQSNPFVSNKAVLAVLFVLSFMGFIVLVALSVWLPLRVTACMKKKVAPSRRLVE